MVETEKCINGRSNLDMSVTVVIPAYRAATYIERAVRSVLTQSDVEVSVVVVEDGIYDNTAEIVSRITGPVRLIQNEKNAGAQSARNQGLAVVETAAVMFLDSDDFLVGPFLLGALGALARANADMVFGIRASASSNRPEPHSYRIPKYAESNLEVACRWLRGASGPSPCGIVWRTSSIKKIGGWNPLMSRNQDGEIVLRAMRHGLLLAQSFIGAGVYWSHEGARISKRRDSGSFECQVVIEELIRDWVSESDSEELSRALDVFRLRVAYQAYNVGYVDLGKFWQQKLTSNIKEICKASPSDTKAVRLWLLCWKFFGIIRGGQIAQLLINLKRYR